MRLLNTATLRLEPDEFGGNNTPPYAILSHTWGRKEVTFADITGPKPETLQGWDKVASTCRQARSHGFRHVWIDSCCIDKSSSAELSEAINSMFRWYAEAEVCYVFLEDLGVSEQLAGSLPRCRWFTRGWCLQELIAPRKLLLYDKYWKCRGSRRRLKNIISDITTSVETFLITRYHYPSYQSPRECHGQPTGRQRGSRTSRTAY